MSDAITVNTNVLSASLSKQNPFHLLFVCCLYQMSDAITVNTNVNTNVLSASLS